MNQILTKKIFHKNLNENATQMLNFQTQVSQLTIRVGFYGTLDNISKKIDVAILLSSSHFLPLQGLFFEETS